MERKAGWARVGLDWLLFRRAVRAVLSVVDVEEGMDVVEMDGGKREGRLQRLMNLLNLTSSGGDMYGPFNESDTEAMVSPPGRYAEFSELPHIGAFWNFHSASPAALNRGVDAAFLRSFTVTVLSIRYGA